MIEAPEAICLAKQLNETIKGKRITYVLPRHTPHKFTFSCGNPDEYPDILQNKIVGESCAYGGMLQINAEDAKLVFTDGVNLRYYAPGAKLPNKHQLLVGFEDESCIIVSVRMYGGILCFTGESFEGGLNAYYESARTKPQVMSDAFTKEYFLGLINAGDVQNKSAKAFLATDQMIPGLGNGVLQDILYNARIHPKTKVSTLSGLQREELFHCVKDTMHEMCAQGGRGSEKDLFDQKGGYVPYLSKDTVGSRCLRCGDMILKEAYMGGSIYYCNTCQKY